MSLLQSLLKWETIKSGREMVHHAASWCGFVRSMRANSQCSPQGFLTSWDTQLNYPLRIFPQVICIRLQAINCLLLPVHHKYKAIIFNAGSCWAGFSKTLCPGTHVLLFSPSSSAFLIVFLLHCMPHTWWWWGGINFPGRALFGQGFL